MMFFSEVRLGAGAACRAWTAAHGCFSALEWERSRESLPLVRETFERARLRISEALAVEGIDPLGFARRLLIHESAAPLSRAGLREVGFVHLEAASGIHLYALWRAYEFGLSRLVERTGMGLGWVRFLRTVFPLVIWGSVFALTGFRPGLWRPLVLVLARWATARFGLRWSRATPIFLALSFDALFGLVFSFGTDRAFSEWAPGEFHYAGAWWGGILGYEWARARGYGSFRAHLALSVASWIAVLPLDLAEGRFAPATPLLSLLTVEFLARGGYLVLFGAALATGFGSSQVVREGLQWMVCLLSRALGSALEILLEGGWMRRVPAEWGFPLAVALGLAVGGFAIRSSRGRTLHAQNDALS